MRPVHAGMGAVRAPRRRGDGIYSRGETVLETLFNRAVESIYDAAPDPSHWPIALQAIADCFEDVGAFLVYQRDDGGFGALGSASLKLLHDEHVREFGGRDFRALRGIERGYYLGREGVTDSDVVSSEEMEQHPFYRMLARHGLKYFVAAIVSPDPRINASIAVQRAIGKAPYGEDEIALMVRLGRHVEKSLRLSTALLDVELSNIGLREALSRLGIGVFALDTLGRIVFSNPAGDRLTGNGLYVVGGRLQFAPSAARGDIERLINQILRGDQHDSVAEPKPMLIERAGNPRPLIIYVLPFVMALTPAQEFLTHARALVLVIDARINDPPDPALVRDVLGLTLSEARIASLVSTGLRPGQAAEKLGITEETARTALKRVFSKVGVSRQSELAALLTRLVLR
jgi:DNA-binding CsgD family transcriptional regulator/PAS domain-containing protein